MRPHGSVWCTRVLAALVGLVLLTACSRGDAFRKVGPAPETITIRLGTLPYMSNALVQIGLDEGYFAEQGLIIEHIAFKNQAEMLTVLAAGQVDVVTPGVLPAVFNMIASGSRVRMVMSLTQHVEQDCSYLAVLARKEDVESGKYSDLASWKDARFMSVVGLIGIDAFYLERALGTVGLTIADLNMQQGPREVHAEALRAGQADIIFEIEPWVTRALAQGDISILAPLESYASGLQGSMIMYGAKLLDNEDAGTRFAMAYLKAAQQYAEGPTERNVEIAAAFTGLDPELVRNVCWAYVPTDGKLNTDGLLEYQNWLYERGEIDRVMEQDEFIDLRFQQEAWRVLTQQGGDE